MPIDHDDDGHADALARVLASKSDFTDYLNSDAGKRSQALGDQLARARASTWKPLSDLSVVLDRLDESGAEIVWLETAVDLMAFGSGGTDQLEDFERGARRYQASRALCAAANAGEIELLAGKRGKPIDPRQFDFGRKLGADRHTLEIDRSGELNVSDAVFDENFKALRLVRINRTALVAWLRARVGMLVPAETKLPRNLLSEHALLPEGARIIPVQPLGTPTLESARLAMLKTPPFSAGYITLEWSWPKIAERIGEVYQLEMKSRGFPPNQNKVPSVASVRRVFEKN